MHARRQFAALTLLASLVAVPALSSFWNLRDWASSNGEESFTAGSS